MNGKQTRIMKKTTLALS